MSDQEPKEKKAKHRSPNYPAVSLKRGIEQIRTLYDMDKRQKVPVGIATKRWGFKEDSSAGQQCVAALSAYGLLDVEGIGPSRKVSVSEDAYRFMFLRPEAQKDMLPKFALAPAINSRVWEHFKHALPQDDVLTQHLILEEKFNPETVGSFISRLKETIEFAGLNSETYTEEQADEPADVSEESQMQADMKLPAGVGTAPNSVKPPAAPAPPANPPPGANERELKFYVRSGDITMRIPINMDKGDFEMLETYLKGLSQALGIASKPDTTEN